MTPLTANPASYPVFIEQVDQLSARLTARYHAHLNCRAGCSGCCHHHLSFFPVEAASIRAAIESLPDETQQLLHQQAEAVNEREARGEAVACPLLVNDRCAIYAARPVICRTQGLPLLYQAEDGNQEVDFCPLNFTSEEAIATLDENHLVSLDDLNLKLAAVNLLYCRENGLSDTEAERRLRMSDIISDIIDETIRFPRSAGVPPEVVSRSALNRSVPERKTGGRDAHAPKNRASYQQPPAMNYSEAIQYLYSLGNETLAMKLELESIRALCHALGDPQRRCPAVHLAGTNGKGSTSAMVEAIAQAAGLRVALYTSPHLIEITERCRLNGREISPEDFTRLAGQVRAAGEQLVSDGVLPAPPTFFEQVTAIAFCYFAECQVDLAILEVGLGGRLDATNICEPLVTAITPIDFDHQNWLGHSIPAIAAEKAGIIKTNAPVVLAPQHYPDEVVEAVVNRCEQSGALLIDYGLRGEPPEIISTTSGMYSFRYRTPVDEYEITLNLRGRHQVMNACTAILIAEQLRQCGFSISKQAILTGLGSIIWPGRLELITTDSPSNPQSAIRNPQLLLDGAHNPAGAVVLRDFLRAHCRVPITMIFGVMSDKALAEIAEILFPIAQTIIATRIDNARTTDPQVIVDAVAGKAWNVVTAASVTEALAAAYRITPADGLICVCGSLYLIGEVKKALRAKVHE